MQSVIWLPMREPTGNLPGTYREPTGIDARGFWCHDGVQNGDGGEVENGSRRPQPASSSSLSSSDTSDFPDSSDTSTSSSDLEAAHQVIWEGTGPSGGQESGMT